MAAGDYAKALEIVGTDNANTRIERLRLLMAERYRSLKRIESAPVRKIFRRKTSPASLTGIYREKYGYETKRSRFDASFPLQPQPMSARRQLGWGPASAGRSAAVRNYKQDGELMDCELNTGDQTQ